jgi:hypothetical protein
MNMDSESVPQVYKSSLNKTLSIILSQAIIPDLATLSSHGAVAVDSATVLIKSPESPPVTGT